MIGPKPEVTTKQPPMQVNNNAARRSLESNDEVRLEKWQIAEESTRHTVNLPTNVVEAIADLTMNSNLNKTKILDHNTTLELYRVLYSRVVKFTSYVEEFSGLSASDRRYLLSRNLEGIVTIRIAPCFKSGLERLPNEQLKELGRPDVGFGSEPVALDQFFRTPWAADETHVDLYKKTIEAIAALPGFDAKASILLQLVALFNTFEADGFEDTKKISDLQAEVTTVLLAYLRSKLGYSKANTAIGKYLSFLPSLRTLSEKIASDRAMG